VVATHLDAVLGLYAVTTIYAVIQVNAAVYMIPAVQPLELHGLMCMRMVSAGMASGRSPLEEKGAQALDGHAITMGPGLV